MAGVVVTHEDLERTFLEHMCVGRTFLQCRAGYAKSLIYIQKQLT